MIDPTLRYVRTSGGRVVHMPDCKHAKRAARNNAALPWRWAAGKTPVEIDRAAAAHGVRYRWCAVCVGRRAIPREAPRRTAPR
jgi:hypothetical protein